jgi:hypothetical protein
MEGFSPVAIIMQDFTYLTFLATYATLSVAAFAVLQRLVVPSDRVAAPRPGQPRA